jgi:hypothetical protein
MFDICNSESSSNHTFQQPLWQWQCPSRAVRKEPVAVLIPAATLMDNTVIDEHSCFDLNLPFHSACCPYTNGNCCPGWAGHCCPHGYICDVASRRCYREVSKLISIRDIKFKIWCWFFRKVPTLTLVNWITFRSSRLFRSKELSILLHESHRK